MALSKINLVGRANSEGLRPKIPLMASRGQALLGDLLVGADLEQALSGGTRIVD